MRGVFDDEEDPKQRKSSGDTELSLSTGTVLFLFVGLVVLCGACFGLGYIIGHRSSAPQSAALPSPGTLAVSQPAPTQTKPVANVQPPAPAAEPASSAADDKPKTDADAPPKSTPSSAAPPKSKIAVTVPIEPMTGTESSSASAQRKVRPALPSTAAPPATSPSHVDGTSNASQQQSRSAGSSQSGIFWVQVAAVSRVDDARALANALTRHGYAVTARRDADNLIHVRIGPFNSRDEANRWRTKLLGDGYNAEIQ